MTWIQSPIMARKTVSLVVIEWHSKRVSPHLPMMTPQGKPPHLITYDTSSASANASPDFAPELQIIRQRSHTSAPPRHTWNPEYPDTEQRHCNTERRGGAPTPTMATPPSTSTHLYMSVDRKMTSVALMAPNALPPAVTNSSPLSIEKNDWNTFFVTLDRKDQRQT